MNIFRRISIGVRHLNNSTLRRFQSSIGNSPLKNMTPTKGIAVVTGLSGVIIFLFEHFRLLRMEKVLDELKVESNATKKERIAQTARTDQLYTELAESKNDAAVQIIEARKYSDDRTDKLYAQLEESRKETAKRFETVANKMEALMTKNDERFYDILMKVEKKKNE